MLAFQLKSVECGSGATPVPVRVAVAGELVALLTNETDPDAAPLEPGVNVSVTCLLPPAAIAAGSVSPVTLKPDPAGFAAETVTEPVPVFDRVTVCVALVPTTTFPKETVAGAALSRKVGAAVAVPDNVTTGGVFGALLVTVSDPLKVPVAVGANLMLRLALWPAGIEIGNVAPTRLNDAPATVAFVTDMAVPPVFETCTVNVDVVFTTMLPKLSAVGDNVICAGAAVTVTVAEADFVLSATLVAFTVKEPADAGAVYRPEAETVPPVAVHATAVFVEPVTVAVNC